MPTVITLTNCCYNAIEIEKCIVHSIMKDYDVGEIVNNWGGTDTKEVILNGGGLILLIVTNLS